MIGSHQPRWLMSFADLTLLLLAFFVFLHARGDGGAVATSMRAAFEGKAAGAGERLDAAHLFLPGEAVLQPAAVYRLRGIGARLAAEHRRARIASEGRAAASSRLDAWELTAARSAAIARALGDGGLAADAVDIAVPATAAGSGAQTFTIAGAA